MQLFRIVHYILNFAHRTNVQIHRINTVQILTSDGAGWSGDAAAAPNEWVKRWDREKAANRWLSGQILSNANYKSKMAYKFAKVASERKPKEIKTTNKHLNIIDESLYLFMQNWIHIWMQKACHYARPERIAHAYWWWWWCCCWIFKISIFLPFYNHFEWVNFKSLLPFLCGGKWFKLNVWYDWKWTFLHFFVESLKFYLKIFNANKKGDWSTHWFVTD